MQQAVTEVEGGGLRAANDQLAGQAQLCTASHAKPEDGPPVRFVPTEQIFLTTVTLRIRQPVQRLASLPFALEDRIAQPIEHAHFALGPEIGEHLYLAAVVDKDVMDEWLSVPPTDGRPDFRLVPDVFILPVPPKGLWNIATLGDRVVVRLPDGTGFATRTELLAEFHAADNSPELVLYIEDGPLPSLPLTRLSGPASETGVFSLFDLRQGRYAPRTPEVPAALLGMAKTAVAGLAAITLLSTINAVVLGRQAARAEADLAAELSKKLPGADLAQTPSAVIEELILRSASGASDPFLLMLSQTGEAWPAGAAVQFRELSFLAADGSMEMLVEAGTIAELETVAAGLELAGVQAELGASATIDGGAEGRLSISAQGAIR